MPTISELMMLDGLNTMIITPNNLPISDGYKCKAIIIDEMPRATNQCKCGCYLHDHNYTNDGTLPCPKHRECKDYDH